MDQKLMDPHISRRALLFGAGAFLTLPALLPARASASAFALSSAVSSALMERARAAMALHGNAIRYTDRIGIADFSRPSRDPRFHIIDMASGSVRSLLVAHGRGSDPQHSGWLQHFSNESGSAASSSGSYVTGALYDGQHGRSRRLIGLDGTNFNAEMRGIVIHAAAYVGPQIVSVQGKVGRSEGCLAVANSDIAYVLETLGEGRLIYSDK